MKSLKTTLLAVIALIAINTTRAQTVDELQAKYIQALGGKAKLATLKSVYQEATTEVMSMTLDSKLWIVYGSALRSEVEIQGQKIITYLSKEKGWMINPMAGSTDPQPIPDDALKAQIGRLTAGGEFSVYKENGYTATLLGKDSVDGKLCHKIKLSKEGTESTIYLDATTYYIAKLVAKVNMGGQDVEQEVKFDNYKKTDDGYVFPYKTTTNNPQAGDIVINVTKLEVNKQIDPKDLEKTN